MLHTHTLCLMEKVGLILNTKGGQYLSDRGSGSGGIETCVAQFFKTPPLFYIYLYKLCE